MEDALSDPAAIPAQAYREDSGAVRAAIIGQTEGGRYLFVIFMRRAGRIRVVTARDATDSEKRRHRR